MRSIHSRKAPAAAGPYSQAIRVNDFVFASGQLPIDPSTGEFPEDGTKEQTRQSVLNAQKVLKAAGLDSSRAIRAMVYLSGMTNFGAMNEVYTQFFTEPYLARSVVTVHILPKEALVEMECVAMKG